MPRTTAKYRSAVALFQHRPRNRQRPTTELPAPQRRGLSLDGKTGVRGRWGTKPADGSGDCRVVCISHSRQRGTADQIDGTTIGAECERRGTQADARTPPSPDQDGGLCPPGYRRAHDLYQCLSIIRYANAALLQGLNTDNPGREHACQIEQTVAQAISLVAQIRTNGRRQISHPVPLDLNAVVVDTEGLLRKLVGERIELIISCAPDLWPVRADRDQIRRVLLHLVTNARDAILEEGTISIRTASVEGNRVGQALGEHFPYAVLSVSDTGVGMDEAIRVRLPEPFFTTKDDGLGIGLTTAYDIISRYGGHIAVSSASGQGTTFDVHLPACPMLTPTENS